MLRLVKWFIGIFIWLCLVGEGVQAREYGIEEERIRKVVGLLLLEGWLLGG